MFVTIHPQNTYEVEFPGHIWSPFIDKPQSDEAVFKII